MSLSKARQLARDLGTVGISSSGTSIHTSVATLNFVGAGNTFAVHNDQVDISIEGGGGTKAGEAIDYPSGTKSPFILNTAVISESITLDNSNSGSLIRFSYYSVYFVLCILKINSKYFIIITFD